MRLSSRWAVIRLFAVLLFARHVHLVTERSIEYSEPSR